MADRMADRMADERRKSREDVVQGIQRLPEALLTLFRGENTGKPVLKIANS